MIQPFGLGTTTTIIDGANIATGTINADSAIISGSLTTDKLAANCVTAAKLSVGKQLTFKSKASSYTTLTLNSDGTYSRPATGSSNLNTTDSRWFIDDANYYPASQAVKNYSTTVYNPGAVGWGILLNMASPFATTGNTGLLIWWTGSSIAVYTVTGVGAWVNIKSISAAMTGYDTLTVQYYGTASPAARLRIFANGVELGAGYFTDTVLGVYGGIQGGYAGFLLTGQTTPTLTLTDIAMGNKNVVVSDGTISAQNIDASSVAASVVSVVNSGGTTTIDGGKITTGSLTTAHISVDGLDAAVITTGQFNGNLITANSITSSMISADGLDAGVIRTGQLVSNSYSTYNSTTKVSNGFCLSNYPFYTTLADGSGQALVQAEFGANIVIAGYKIGDITARAIAAIEAPAAASWTSSSRVFYRGNNSCTTRQGTANIGCLSLVSLGSTSSTGTPHLFRGTIQPTASSDNLDGLRTLRLKVYTTDGVLVGTIYQPIPDRMYEYLASDSSALNATTFDIPFVKYLPTLTANTLTSSTTPYSFYGYLCASIGNAYGWSTEQYYKGDGAGSITSCTTPSGFPAVIAYNGSAGYGGTGYTPPTTAPLAAYRASGYTTTNCTITNSSYAMDGTAGTTADTTTYAVITPSLATCTASTIFYGLGTGTVSGTLYVAVNWEVPISGTSYYATVAGTVSYSRDGGATWTSMQTVSLSSYGSATGSSALSGYAVLSATLTSVALSSLQVKVTGASTLIWSGYGYTSYAQMWGRVYDVLFLAT